MRAAVIVLGLLAGCGSSEPDACEGVPEGYLQRCSDTEPCPLFYECKQFVGSTVGNCERACHPGCDIVGVGLNCECTGFEVVDEGLQFFCRCPTECIAE